LEKNNALVDNMYRSSVNQKTASKSIDVSFMLTVWENNKILHADEESSDVSFTKNTGSWGNTIDTVSPNTTHVTVAILIQKWTVNNK